MTKDELEAFHNLVPHAQLLFPDHAVPKDFPLQHQRYWRHCTCHPSEAPVPCEQRYALSECVEQKRWRDFWCVV